MVKIIGTDHLMSKEAIEGIIKDENPDVIAVELCETRFELMVRPKLNNYIDEKPKEDNTLIGKISKVIKRKAEEEKLEYGSDQINACLYAKANDIPLEFVDLDIMKIKELMEKIPKNESEGFMKELSEFENQSMKEQVEKDVNETLKEMKEKFPIAFEFLINMRNLVIINNLLKLERKYPNKKILCFLGKGHKEIVERALW